MTQRPSTAARLSFSPAPDPPLLVGAHFSIARGLDQAVAAAARYGCPCLQLFTKNAATWRERTLTPDDIERFSDIRRQTGIDRIASHAAYLINLAGEPTTRQRSMAALHGELTRSGQLRLPWVVLHPGAHKGDGDRTGIRRIAEAINTVLADIPEDSPRLLLETTAGQGTCLGHTFEQMADLLDAIVFPGRIGVCMDTGHIFAAGYDFRTRRAYLQTMDAFDRAIGLSRLFLIHANDSKTPLGSKVDRHEHIGRGHIGPDGFRWLMTDPRMAHIPKILETPKDVDGQDGDRMNLDRLVRLASAVT